MNRCPRCCGTVVNDRGEQWCARCGPLYDRPDTATERALRKEVAAGRQAARLSRVAPPPPNWQTGLEDILEGPEAEQW
jgi:hypothetical protein